MKYFTSRLPLLIVICLLLISGCAKDKTKHIDCDKIKQGLIIRDKIIVGEEINEICNELHPNATSTDEYGQQRNFILLTEMLNQSCNEILSAVGNYCGIYTNPPMSEISF